MLTAAIGFLAPLSSLIVVDVCAKVLDMNLSGPAALLWALVPFGVVLAWFVFEGISTRLYSAVLGYITGGILGVVVYLPVIQNMSRDGISVG